ncbi:MAG: hypothetical protein M3P52_01420 [Actinomycetota bacterium]|nr:hypothetical protein [Actinomycetota bacterium]
MPAVARMARAVNKWGLTMYLYTRMDRMILGKADEAIAFATEAAAYVTDKTGTPVYTWASVFGAPLGTVTWSARLDSMAALGALQDQLAVDPGFAELGKRGSELFVNDISDSISQGVASTSNEGPRAFASVVTAQCAPGRIADAMAWGVDIMETVGKLTGLPTMMLRSMYGPFAGLGWVSAASSMAEMDTAEAAMSADPTYIKKLDQGGDFFLPGSGNQILLRRLA